VDEMANDIGSFTLFSSNPEINGNDNGPDRLFRALELMDLDLKRNPAALAKRKSFEHTFLVEQD
jgi:hypothetical protein